ncbi:MAG: hypothetical protein M0Z39_05030 [Actinomycetota bacterium]|nr:hypothetical protein [Actinomycetota bacterium]
MSTPAAHLAGAANGMPGVLVDLERDAQFPEDAVVCAAVRHRRDGLGRRWFVFLRLAVASMSRVMFSFG